MREATARAPGKVMIAGEYAVLDGHDAWVMAVDRHATATVRDAVHSAALHGSQDLPREVTEALALAHEKGLLACIPPVAIDARALVEADGRKLGLGSSAAQCVAALGAALASEGHDVTSMRETIAQIARSGHRIAQGGGSGVDVLSSAMGGLLCVRFPDGIEGAPVLARHRWPDGVHWQVLWTGTPVRTSELIASVKALRERDGTVYERRVRAIAGCTQDFGTAIVQGDTAAVLSALARHYDAMEALGREARVPIVTDTMRTLSHEALALGAAIKPSGAGGGDVVLAVATDPNVLAMLAERSHAAGFVPLTLQEDRWGVQAG